MSFLGGIMKSLVNPMSLMQLAMGPAGWASLAMKAIGTAIAQQVIQQLGQQLGLPQGVINMAQTAFANASGQPGIGKQNLREVIDSLNLSPRQAGDLQRAAEFDIQDMLKSLGKAANEGKEKASRGNSKAGNSMLRRIAEAMAQAMDNKVGEMEKLANDMDKVKHIKDAQTNSTKLQTDLQVATQEFGMLMQSTSNMIKTIGEGMAQMARKG
jgi:hypothetical protein